MPKSEYDPHIVNELRRRLWSEAYSFAKDLAQGETLPESKPTVSGLELLTTLHIMEEETRHHWVEDNKAWNNILESEY